VLACEAPSGRDVGVAWLRLWSRGSEGYGFVDTETPELSMAVRPEHRGRGIGTQLLDRLLAEADRSYRAVSLSVSDGNPAVRLYQRLGFVAMFSVNGSTTMRRDGPRECDLPIVRGMTT
jgi:GNAT superfamily N-acetyltransferase